MTVDFTYVLHKQPAYDYSKAYDLSSKLQPYAHTIIVICHTILHVKHNRTQQDKYGMPHDSVRTNRMFLRLWLWLWLCLINGRIVLLPT